MQVIEPDPSNSKGRTLLATTCAGFKLNDDWKHCKDDVNTRIKLQFNYLVMCLIAKYLGLSLYNR
jgi:hypothetical protein